MQNKTTNILLGIIALALIIGIYFLITRQNAVSPVVQVPSDSSNTPTPSETPNTQNQNNGTVTPPPAPTPAPATKQYTNASFGFAVNYPASYSITQSNGNSVGLLTDGATPTSPIISITWSKDAAPDPSGKWGPYTISYENNGYVVTQQNEMDGSTITKPITPIAYTPAGLPIFNGVIPNHGFGAYDYIVALSHTKFLKISGPDMAGTSYNAANDPTLAIAIAKAVTVQ